MSDWDVIIAGGGPAGTSTAYNLLRREPGLAGRVLVLEKARYPRFKLCGGGITDYGCRVLASMGLDVCEVPHVPVDEVQVAYQGYGVSFWQQPALRIVRRDELDAWLGGKAAALGAAVHDGEAVTGVERVAGGVVVRTAAGSYQAPALVVADGSKGTLRRRLGFEDGGPVARVIEILTPADDPASRDLHARRRAFFDFSFRRQGLQGYYWDFPCLVRGELRVNRGVYDSQAAPGGERPDLKGILGTALAARGIDLERCELQGHPIHGFDPRGRFAQPHIVLAGDAAGADPLLGEGISFALGYGAVAAAAVAGALARGDFSFADYGAQLLASAYGSDLKLRYGLATRFYRYGQPLTGYLLLFLARAALHLVPRLRRYRTPPPADRGRP